MKHGFVFLVLLFFCGKQFGQHISTVKLFRYGAATNEKPAVLTADGQKLDVSAFVNDYDEAFFASNGIERLENWLLKNKSKCSIVPNNARIASCVARPSKIIAIGLNYEAHIKEGGAHTPNEPVIFLKATSALCGPYDSVIIPKNSFKTDYEVELAVIIGRKASYITEANALNYIAGYTIINDYSEREWQLERAAGQWDKGKSSNTFAPLGPWLVTAKEVGDPHNLEIWLKVNGIVTQQANTRDMIFKVARLVSEISQYMTLMPGDVIATGTPSGVGLGQRPPVYLKSGDIIELGIEKLGSQKQIAGSAMKYFLTEAEYLDYQQWVSLGIGGIPHTLEGYRMVKELGSQMKDPTDIKRISGDIGKTGDIQTLFDLPKRSGHRPAIAPFAVPHRQTNQHNDTIIRNKQIKIFDEKVSGSDGLLVFKTSYLEKNSPGVFLKDSAAGNPTIVGVSHAEIGHMHLFDGSMHIILSPSDTKEVIEKGWGELHGLAGEGRAAKTYLMIYSPKTESELIVTKLILDAAVTYSGYKSK